MTSVVFGTNAWEFWRRTVVDIGGTGNPILFYESWGPALSQATWTGMVTGYEESPSGYPPRAWRRFREPIAALEDAASHDGGPGFFAGYYLVERLRRLDVPIAFADIRTLVGGQPLAQGFVPIGPIAVTWGT
jgi:hypothetical protein